MAKGSRSWATAGGPFSTREEGTMGKRSDEQKVRDLAFEEWR